MKKGFTTRSIHTKFPKPDAYGALQMPIYESVAYEFENANEMADVFSGRKFGHAYSRTSNPTVQYFEEKIKNVTGAQGVLAMASGMACISNVLIALVEQGGNIVSSRNLFGHTYAMFKETFPNLGIEVRFADMNNAHEVASLTDEKTRLYFFETVTNPQLEISDFEKIVKLAKEKNVVTVCDTTITPPNVFSSKHVGIDVEVFSCTKFVSGGATAFGGVLIDNGLFNFATLPSMEKWSEKFGKDALIARMRKEIFRHFGGAMTAHTAHFMNLGLDIMDIRVERCINNCLRLGDYLQNNDKIQRVDYPGLPNHEGFLMAKKYFNGKPGAVMTFDLETKDKCFAFMDALQIIKRATNLNDNKTLIIHPYSTIYAEFSHEEKTKMNIRETMFRLSVGIEDAEDLVEDLDSALSKI